jgi:uncharacterized protein YukE
MKNSDEIREAIKQLNRRMTNCEAFLRMLEQRIESSERTSRALDEKIANNTEKILHIILKEIPRSRREIEALHKYLKLILKE